MVSLLKYWKPILTGLSVLSLVGGFFLYGHGKYKAGYRAAQAEYKTQLEQFRKKRDGIRKEVHMATDEDLNARLEPWFRD